MICVVGALALDVIARRDRFLAGTSNPASIRFAAGGVGYRIWRRLPPPKSFITAVGGDPAGKWLLAELRAQGERPRALLLERYPTARYCALMESGRLLFGAADMEVIERGLTWKRLAPRFPRLAAQNLLVLEANLAPSMVGTLIRRCAKRTRIVFESVSVEKLMRHADHLRDLYLLSVNEDELAALRGRVGAERRFLIERGIGNLLVTRGPRGARLHSRTDDGKLRVTSLPPARVIRTQDTTGAGDRLLAALLSRVIGGASPETALPEAMREVEAALEEGSL